MSKWWGVGEEDDHIPPQTAEYIPPMRFEAEKSSRKVSNGSGCGSGGGHRGGESKRSRLGNKGLSLYVKSTRIGKHKLGKRNKRIIAEWVLHFHS